MGVLAAPSDPLLLPPQDDAALHLLAEMEFGHHIFAFYLGIKLIIGDHS